MTGYRTMVLAIFLMAALLYIHPVSAQGDFRFDIATRVAGADNYTKHWSNIFPPDPQASIIIYSYAGNMSYKRMSAIGFLYVVYDPYNNIVAVEKIDQFKRSYEPAVAYCTIHPSSDWIEGNYKTRIVVYDRINRDAWENIPTDPFAIGADPTKYREFYETGSNAESLGFLLSLGSPVAQSVLSFQINKSASLYPPDRFLLHDARFIDNSNERILGEKLQIEVKIDNNYMDDGTVKLAMLVDNNIVATKDVAVKGLNTSTVIFDAKAGKIGSFKLHFGADTPDLEFRNAEIAFSIKNEGESTRLDMPRINITGMNVDKEFISAGDNVTVTVTAVNNGKSGSKIITVYSNRVPVGSAQFNLQYLEEKTVEVPIVLKSTGINRITVSDSPSLFRNVFVEELSKSSLDKNPVVRRLEENPLKLSMIVVFMAFAGVLVYVKKRLT